MVEEDAEKEANIKEAPKQEHIQGTGKVINRWADKGMALEGLEDNSHWSAGGKTKHHRGRHCHFLPLYMENGDN